MAVAYYIDPETQAWSRWFAERAEITTLSTLDNMQGVIALGAVSGPTPTPTATVAPTPSPTATPAAGGDFSRIIFLHHSVGANLIEQAGDCSEGIGRSSRPRGPVAKMGPVAQPG